MWSIDQINGDLIVLKIRPENFAATVNPDHGMSGHHMWEPAIA